MLKQYRVLLGAVALALMSQVVACSMYDSKDLGQQVGLAVIEEASFAGCDQLRKSKPTEASQVRTSLDEAVIPLLTGEQPDLSVARVALVNALNGKVDTRYVDRVFRRIDVFVQGVPAAEQDKLYGVALLGAVESCREGLMPPG